MHRSRPISLMLSLCCIIALNSCSNTKKDSVIDAQSMMTQLDAMQSENLKGWRLNDLDCEIKQRYNSFKPANIVDVLFGKKNGQWYFSLYSMMTKTPPTSGMINVMLRSDSGEAKIVKAVIQNMTLYGKSSDLFVFEYGPVLEFLINSEPNALIYVESIDDRFPRIQFSALNFEDLLPSIVACAF